MSFSSRDYDLKVTPEEGTNKGKPLRVLSWSKVSYDPGAKATHVKGHRELPNYIALGTAEPKGTVEGLTTPETSDVRAHIGGIYGAKFTLTLTAKRPGTTKKKVELRHCQISGGMGADVDENGSIGKMEVLCLDILENGESIYDKRAA